MTKKMRLAIDAMGGDEGVAMTIPGSAILAERRPDVEMVFYGREQEIKPALEKHPHLMQRSEIVHTDHSVSMDEKPSKALRAGRWKSSMWMALQAVRDKQVDATISAGNTGALIAMAKFCVKTMPYVDRPVLSALWPTVKGDCIVLDVGANIGADAEQLVTSAILGEAMARCLFQLKKPKLALLNVGVEEVKGLDEVKTASQILQTLNLPIEYCGFIEGNKIGLGDVDVVVTEGFTGNIAIKTGEGTAKQVSLMLREAIERSLIAKIGYILVQGAFKAVKERVDPSHTNGAVLLGLNGVVIKSHGGTDPLGYATAIETGCQMVENSLLEKISADMASFDRFQHADVKAKVASAGGM